jgi:hypothetical protein
MLVQIFLHRGGLNDRRAEYLEQARRALRRRLAHASDDARQRRDLFEEPTGGDPLGRMRDEDFLPGPQPAPLLDVAGDEFSRPGCDRRAQDERVTWTQERQEIVDCRADLAQVRLDVRERRRPEG